MFLALSGVPGKAQAPATGLAETDALLERALGGDDADGEVLFAAYRSLLTDWMTRPGEMDPTVDVRDMEDVCGDAMPMS